MLSKTKLSDSELIAAIQNGSKDALLQLYSDNYKSVNKYVTNNKGNSDDTDDILQDAVIVIWEKIKKNELELKAKLSTIIMAISRNLWLKKLNKLSRHDGIDNLTLIAKFQTHSNAFIEENKNIVLNMMEQLGENCRQILTYFYFENLEMNKIAELMNYNNSDTVKAKKYQCFKHLQQLMVARFSKNDFL